MAALEFWVSIGSTYSYLSVMRIGDLARARGVRVTWHPFSVRAIMVEMNNIPFVGKPTKAAYMWRDIGRRADKLGIPAALPAPYPLAEFDRANRVAVLGCAADWGPDYIRAAYRRWMQDGDPPGEEPNLSASLRDAGQDPDAVIAASGGAAAETAYRAATDAARARGIFGAPSFIAGGDLFWGDDRLEDAFDWAAARG